MARLRGQKCDFDRRGWQTDCVGPAVGNYWDPFSNRDVYYCSHHQLAAIASLGDWEVTEITKRRINRVLDSGRLSYGPFCRDFEREIAQAHACNYGVVSNSGTSSLQVALQTLKEIHGWADGDEVIVPASTFVATVNIVIHNRLKPVLVDIEQDYYAIDPSLIEQAITSKTRCIIPVHPYGQPADMLAIMDICELHNLYIIEDSCEAMFVDVAGGMVGSFGDIGVFSTYMAHLITTGVGGVAITDNPDYAETMRSLVNHGRSPVYLSIDDDDAMTADILRKRFEFERVGHSFRITEIEAALSLEQIETRVQWLASRQHVAMEYTRVINDGLRQFLQPPKVRPDSGHAFMMYPLVWLGDGGKWPLVTQLERCGIETREMLPIVDQPVYTGMFDPSKYPVARWIGENGFYIGCHQRMLPEHVLRVQEVLHVFTQTSKTQSQGVSS